MIPDRILSKMRAALLVCGATTACTRGKGTMDTNASDAALAGNDATGASANGAGTIDGAAGASDLDGGAADLAGDDVDPVDASLDAPYGTIACPIHGAHARLPDGGVDRAGMRPAPAGSSGGLAGITGPSSGVGGGLSGIQIGRGGDPCPACGMGGVSMTPKAVVTTGPVKLTGSTNQDVATREVRARNAKSRACYQMALNSDPDLQGKIVVTIKVNATGAATDVTTTGTIATGNVINCITRNYKTISTPDLANATIAVPLSLVKQ